MCMADSKQFAAEAKRIKLMICHISQEGQSYSQSLLRTPIKWSLFLTFIYLFIFGCIRSQVQHTGSSLQHAGSFVGIHRLFIAVRGLLSSCGAWAAERMGSVVAAHGLSCPAACGLLVSRPGIKCTSPALEGRFLTTGPPGKSLKWSLK